MHAFFTAHPIDADTAAGLPAAATGRDRVIPGERVVYMHTPDGLGRSKTPEAVGKLLRANPTTARNWRTVLTLLEMAEG